MEDTTIIGGLVKRRAELLGDLSTAQERVEQLHHDIASLGAVIRQFDPSYPIGAIRAKYRKPVTATEYASMSRAVLEHLRQARAPLTGNELADRIIAERGLNGFDRSLVRNMRKRVGVALRYQRTNGIVEESEGEGRLVAWRIAG